MRNHNTSPAQRQVHAELHGLINETEAVIGWFTQDAHRQLTAQAPEGIRLSGLSEKGLQFMRQPFHGDTRLSSGDYVHSVTTASVSVLGIWRNVKEIGLDLSKTSLTARKHIRQYGESVHTRTTGVQSIGRKGFVFHTTRATRFSPLEPMSRDVSGGWVTDDVETERYAYAQTYATAVAEAALIAEGLEVGFHVNSDRPAFTELFDAWTSEDIASNVRLDFRAARSFGMPEDGSVRRPPTLIERSTNS